MSFQSTSLTAEYPISDQQLLNLMLQSLSLLNPAQSSSLDGRGAAAPPLWGIAPAEPRMDKRMTRFVFMLT